MPRDRYGGKLLLRFDDTNPSKEKEEFEEAIVNDLKSLSITPAAVSWTSDFFPQILKIATRMLPMARHLLDLWLEHADVPMTVEPFEDQVQQL